MSKSPVNFKTETQLTTSGVSLVLNAIDSGEKKVINSTTFFNSSTTISATVTVHRLLSTGALQDSNIVKEKVMPPRTSWIAQELQGKVIEQGYEVTATTSTDSIINAESDGYTYS